jgi:hypothetical protein
MSQAPVTTVFTLRDLNRQPQKVLDAVREFGRAEIRTRSGEVFTVAIKAEEPPKRSGTELPDFEAHWKRLRGLGLVPPLAGENERINRIMGGEE